MKNKFEKFLNKLTKKDDQEQELVVDTIEDVYIDEDLQTSGNTNVLRKDEVAKFAPSEYNDLKSAVDALKSNGRIIISFKNMDETNYRRSINFLSGIIYAWDGSLHSIEPKIFEFSIR